MRANLLVKLGLAPSISLLLASCSAENNSADSAGLAATENQTQAAEIGRYEPGIPVEGNAAASLALCPDGAGTMWDQLETTLPSSGDLYSPEEIIAGEDGLGAYVNGLNWLGSCRDDFASFIYPPAQPSAPGLPYPAEPSSSCALTAAGILRALGADYEPLWQPYYGGIDNIDKILEQAARSDGALYTKWDGDPEFDVGNIIGVLFKTAQGNLNTHHFTISSQPMTNEKAEVEFLAIHGGGTYLGHQLITNAKTTAYKNRDGAWMFKKADPYYSTFWTAPRPLSVWIKTSFLSRSRPARPVQMLPTRD